ncbi:hypothetical protein DAPPUDRAFT_109864 [Daphnia pulex]|uniref:USP domain-containing protein n=1 Tax=Daphnia pulex TaxID=6669 RepID=E9H4F8_DAPPU|nr:hypothetical protein DAPPUDRAFT_109864 [Daphnia pulex]|eukprot:EFX73375.1 hypothetical protein DAPPUDRAFT_109864 [Daphnia pulex]
MVQRIWLTSPGASNPPSRSLAAFLNVTPLPQQWPKSTKISNWILSLFKMLTLDGRSSIVAEVISLKAPKLMEQSIIPVIRDSTAPVLPYLLLTMRDQPQEKVEPILKPAITLDYPRPSDQHILSRLDSVPALFDSRFSKDCNAPIILNSNCFTRSVLGSITTNHQNVLSQLQQVLIFLRHSFRAAYSPAAFIKASRPPWFETGRQQDCSEFLRYLMDSLYEQEKADRSVLQCGHRWTVGVGKDKEVTDEVEPENEDKSEKANIELQRWVTEEDLTVGLAIPEEKLPVDKCIQVADSLSNVHSDSTETVDSGIQSVVDGQEDKVKSCSELDNQQPDQKQQLSLIHKIFGGKITTTYRCLACGTESHHQDFFTDLHLAFPDPVSSTATRVTRQLPSPDTEGLSLDSLLKFYFTAEKLQGENRYHCDNCAELVQETERILCVTEAPQHLLLSLLRFHYDRLLQRRGKITTQVSYPQRLELPIEGGTTVTYVLLAVVIHSGRFESRRYFGNGNSTEPWFMFNDSQVSRTDFESLISLSRKYPTDTPYLLWYRRVSDDQDGSFPDQGKSTPSVPLILPTDLKRMVDEDNAKFVQERLRNISRPIRSSLTPPKNDDDQDPHRRDPFQDNSGSRFIF